MIQKSRKLQKYVDSFISFIKFSFALIAILVGLVIIISLFSDSTPTECTISTTSEIKAGIVKTAKFAPGTDCEAMRQLAEEGKPLPTIIDSTPKPSPSP